MSIGGNFWKDSWTGTKVTTTFKQGKPIHNKYKPESSGVGASSISNRRAKNRSATVVGDQPGNQFMVFNTLGRYNKYTKTTNAILTPIEPSAPTLDSITRNTNNDLVLNFTLGFNGGSVITNMEYSTDSGFNWTSTRTVTSPIVILGLSTSVRYPVVIRSRNRFGFSSNSIVFLSTIEPSAPTLNSTTRNSNNDLVLNFELAADGGSPVTGIDYTIDNEQNWSITSNTSSPIVITGVPTSNNFTYAIRARNLIGKSLTSNSLQTLTVPSLNSYYRTSNTQVQFYFTLGTDGGSPVTGIQYSSDNGITWNSNIIAATSATTSIIIDLSNSDRYTVRIRARNATGIGPQSNSLQTISAPSAPTLNSITRTNDTFDLSFISPTSDGGSTINNIQYSINGGNWTDTNLISSPISITIVGFSTSVSYPIVIRAKNTVGSGPQSISLQTPLDKPGAPTINSITRLSDNLTLNFTTNTYGRSDITKIQYSTNGGTNWNDTNLSSSPTPLVSSSITITNVSILSGPYNVIIRSFNAVDNSVNSNSFQTPGAPTIGIVTPINTKLIVNWTPGSNGNSPITDMEYSLNSGGWISSGSISSPITISSLTNGSSYSVRIRAKNLIGYGSESTPVSGTPNTVIRSFTTVGTTSWTTPVGVTSVDYLVVGGGGGSGGGYNTGGGGGGGGGMVLTGVNFSVTSGTQYQIVVGDGGIAGITINDGGLPGSQTSGGSGSISKFDNFTSLGGGGGVCSRRNPNHIGGSKATSTTASTGGGSGNALESGSGNWGAGGGGGGNDSDGQASVAVRNELTVIIAGTGGDGGLGKSSSITGSPVTYGAGGRGADGGLVTNNASVAGVANTGNGARGGGRGSDNAELTQSGAKGGSGIVILRY